MNGSAESPTNWHFKYLAPLYDFAAIEKDYPLILDGLDLEAADRLLDLGGGTGEFCHSLIQCGVLEARQCTVLDVTHEMLTQARDKGLLGVVRGDARALPLAGESFDAVFMGDTFHHMGDRVSVLREVRRVLKPEGRLLLEEFDPATLLGKSLEWLEQLSGMGSDFVTPDELTGLLNRAGLELRTLERSGFVYYLTAGPRT